MKLNRTDFLRKCQFPLMLACGSMPVPVLLLANSTPQALMISWLLPAVYALLACACIVVPGKRRVAAGVLCAAGIILLGLRTLPVRESVLLLALPVMYAALLFYSLQFGAWTRDVEIAYNWYAIGIAAHALAQILVNASHRTGEAQYAPAEGILLGSFLGFLLLMLCSLNRSSMSSASMGRQRIPARMRRRNRTLTLAFFALVLFVSAIPRVIALIEAGWNWLLNTFLAIIDLILNLFPAQEHAEGASSGGSTAMESLGAIEEPGLLAQIIEKIVMVLGIAIGAALIVLALWMIAGKLRKLLRFLWERLSSFASAASEDYEDEITDTREGGSVERGAILAKLRRRMTFADEARMTPTQRIRYRYGRLMRRHPDWHEGTTARENLPGPAARLYEQARYSGRPADQEEAEQFINETQNM